ncbi:MAG: phage minor head protein, partial [Dehalococcoidia bacterium]|nr:phage minor head protein [Dehalococcoidia bacterium]
LGHVWFPRALREGWAQGNARLRAAVARRRKSWDDEHTKAPRKPKPDVTTVFDLEFPEIAEYIATRPIQYAPIAAQTTVDMFRAQLIAGVDQGLGIDAIVRNILGEQLPGISRWRSTVIARTEILSAGNSANLANYRASGVVQKKRWLSTRDARTRESHRTEKWPKGSAVVPLNQPFVLPSGARLLHPGDTSLGAPLSEIAQCRCSVAPEVSLPGIPDFVPGG